MYGTYTQVCMCHVWHVHTELCVLCMVRTRRFVCVMYGTYTQHRGVEMCYVSDVHRGCVCVMYDTCTQVCICYVCVRPHRFVCVMYAIGLYVLCMVRTHNTEAFVLHMIHPHARCICVSYVSFTRTHNTLPHKSVIYDTFTRTHNSLSLSLSLSHTHTHTPIPTPTHLLQSASYRAFARAYTRTHTKHTKHTHEHTGATILRKEWVYCRCHVSVTPGTLFVLVWLLPGFR
jgi:hypothetical protein